MLSGRRQRKLSEVTFEGTGGSMSRNAFVFGIAVVALFAVLAVTPMRAADTTRPAASGRIFELRKYYAMPGKLDALNARFRDHTCALFQKHGMELVGFWTPTEDPESDGNRILVYILAFPSKEAKAASWKAFQSDPDWIKARTESEKDGKLVEKVESTLMSATDYSAIK
jgi:hypothetical protein